MRAKLYALDFDGVICDSAVETGMAGWKVATQIWANMPEKLPAELSAAFKQVRPVMETGYEAILIMRLLFEGLGTNILLSHFHERIEALMIRDQLFVDELKQQFGTTRDQWIADDLPHWIEMNPLFDGIANKLRQIDNNNCVIVTTKQERFVDHILSANDIHFPAEHIYGLDRKLSKPQILTDLSTSKPEAEILFVEDRLPTLLNVIEDDRLKHVQLYFADWGYNTDSDKESAAETNRIQPLTLNDFALL